MTRRRTAALLTAMAAVLTLTACAPSPTVVRGFAMDTAVTLTLYDADDSLGAQLLGELAEVERLLSWNVEGGDVARLNAEKAVVSPQLADILSPLLPLAEESGGEYSFLMRDLCALWNVTGESPRVPDQAEIDALLPLAGGRVVLDGDTVRLPDGGSMDLGSIGKGVACGALYRRLTAEGKAGVIAVGGSVVACGEKPSGGAWQIAVASPDDRNQSVGTLSLSGGRFVSTSGNGERYFEQDGVRYHHILSGVTGRPCDSGLNAVTVVADNGALADALSTVCFLLGYEASLPLLSRYHAEAVFQAADGTLSVTDGLRDGFEAAS